jgi:hypothetical protein
VRSIKAECLSKLILFGGDFVAACGVLQPRSVIILQDSDEYFHHTTRAVADGHLRIVKDTEYLRLGGRSSLTGGQGHTEGRLEGTHASIRSHQESSSWPVRSYRLTSSLLSLSIMRGYLLP